MVRSLRLPGRGSVLMNTAVRSECARFLACLRHRHRRLAVRSVAGNALPLLGERVEAGAAVALGPGPAGLRNGLQTLAADLVVAFGPLYREKIKSLFRLASTSKMRPLVARKTPSKECPVEVRYAPFAVEVCEVEAVHGGCTPTPAMTSPRLFKLATKCPRGIQRFGPVAITVGCAWHPVG